MTIDNSLAIMWNMTKKTLIRFSSDIVEHISKLANIPLINEESLSIAEGFNETIKVVDKILVMNLTNIEPTHHLSGSENIFREDVVDVERMFTQQQALMNAKSTYNGFFVVPLVIEQDN